MIKVFMSRDSGIWKPTLLIDIHYTHTIPKVIWKITRRTNLRKANERIKLK